MDRLIPTPAFLRLDRARERPGLTACGTPILSPLSSTRTVGGRTGPGSGANSRGPANGLGREIGGRGRASDGPPGAGSDNPWELSEDVLAKLDPAVRSLYLGFKSRISHGGQGSGVGSRCGRVTISTCGTIFREKTPRDLRKSATLIPSAADVVRAISLHSRVFLITQVEDDQSASNVDKALAEAKITAAAGGKSDESCASSDRITSAVGPVRSHHVLFCEKHVSKVSMARQIEPALHVDNDKATARELQRFLPRVLLITDKVSRIS